MEELKKQIEIQETKQHTILIQEEEIVEKKRLSKIL